MTISATGARFTYAGNGSSTAFSFPRLFFAATDLKVYVVSALGAVTLKTLATHYSVTGAGDLNGGTVNFTTAPATGETVIIVRETAATQGLDLDNVTSFPMQSIEAAFDRMTLMINELKDQLARAVAAPLTRTAEFDYTFPVPTGNKLLGVKGDGSGLQLFDQVDSEITVLWGGIGGSIGDQTDIASVLNGKQAADPLLDDIAALTDPNADRIPFWDDSAGHIVWLTVGANLTISGTTISASGGGGGAGDWGSIGGNIGDQVDLQAVFTSLSADISGLVADVGTLNSALSGKSNVGHGHSISDVTGLQPALDGKQASGSYAAASHTHTASAITDFSEAVDDRVAALFVAGTDITLTYNDASNTFTVAYSGTSGGAEVLANSLSLPTNAQSVTLTLSKAYKRLDLFMIGASHAGGVGTSQNFRIQVSSDGGSTWTDIFSASANGNATVSAVAEVIGAHMVASGGGGKTARSWAAGSPGTVTYTAITQTQAINRVRFITDGAANNFDAGIYNAIGHP